MTRVSGLSLLPLLGVAVLSGGCARADGHANSATSGAPIATDADCTLDTPLVAGVPGSPSHLIPSDINPNGASELAALMRDMQRDLSASREAILHGGSPPPMHARHRRMRCSWPTVASDRNPQFDAMAQAYLARVRAFEAGGGDRRRAHDAVVEACASCHETTCSGPLEAILALRLGE